MSWKKILIACTALTITTVAGYFFSWYGASQLEMTGENNIYLILGKTLLWPWLLWDTVKKFIFPDDKIHSFYSMAASQIIGYFFLFYIFNVVRKKWKNHKN